MWRMLLSSFALLFLLAGCSTPKYAFEVQVTNAGNKPLTAGLIKHSPQGGGGLRPAVEEGWAAPEDVAINAPVLSDRHWGVVIPPGQTMTLGPQTGAFRQGVTAALRIYVGDHTIERLMGYSRTDPDRLEVPLMPGLSRYVVSNRSGRLAATTK
jgi:hypothetical protein